MTMESIVNRLIDCVERFCRRRWEPWEMVALGLGGLVLIVMAVRAHRKEIANEKHLRQRTPRIRV